MRYPGYIEEDFTFPDFYPIKINHIPRGIKNPETNLNIKLDKILPTTGIHDGDRVAIGVGSRGIKNISLFVATLCNRIRKFGARPFIIPAMGSHGGATPQGQVKVLEKLGITEKACNAPILSSMEVEMVGKVMDEVPVYFSRDALDMDHSICINRIKPHTKFKGPVESGLYKMLCIGMGKHKGALTYHNMALKHGFFPLLKAMGDEVISKTNFRFGIALVEDFFDNTMEIQAIAGRDIFIKEAQLLDKAREHFPHLPFKNLDVLVINEIGKEISGSGMDPNVTGRTFDLMEDDFSKSLAVQRIAILNLSQKTAGNGIGLGNADIITEKVFASLNYETTLMNALTSMSLRKAFIPVRLPNDQKAIQAAFMTLGPVQPDQVRAVIIRDTLHTQTFLASKALLPEIRALENAEILGKISLLFDEKKNMPKLKPGTILTTDEEDRQIKEAIATDPDTFELTDEHFEKMKPISEFPELQFLVKRGRPPKENPKQLISIRLDSDIVEHLKASGKGWQTRLNDTIRDSLGLKKCG